MHRFKVSGMSCGHCVAAVTREIQGIDPEAQVRVDLPAGLVEVDSTRSSDDVRAAIVEAGYEAQWLSPA